MKIFVKVKAGAKVEQVDRIDSTHFSLSVKEPPKEGRANWAVIRALSIYLKIPVTNIRLISGHTSRNKVFEVI